MAEPSVSLREYIERILVEHDRVHNAEHKEVSQRALEMERRVEGLNQLRQDVLTDRGQFVTKDVVDGLLQAALERAAAVKKENDAKADALAASDDALAKSLADRTEALAHAMDGRIKPLETFHSRAALIGSGLVFVGGIVGALVIKALGA